ncbi:MAG TPA: peptide ABC transporter substrate-binding protein [Spirochaetales bacterium]|nr:peptide ABC transporter substrate-binding protein [Spirochaetales bacterium]HRY55149.1 peptide ABC transporter substrate-binding protein [Spirochaetia bacterium]HRZ64568.1 peptide ABC transporter substrate-binding protein [Spirochaetia bacterium]
MKRILAVLFALVAVMGLAAQDFIFNNASEPQSLDPALIQGVPEHRLYMSLFEGLTTFDPKTNLAVPGLAEKWTVSKDMKTYTFKLRKAVWSDGTPIKAQDVVDSWLRILDPATASNYAYMPAAAIEGAEAYNSNKGPKEGVKIKAVDASTFEVTFVGPLPYALDMLTHYAFAVMPMHAIAKFGADWIKPGNFVGNGPFVLKEWKPQDKIVVEKNAKYWDAKNVKLKTITYLAIEDQNVSYEKFKAGEIDWDTQIPPAKIDEIKLRKDYQVIVGTTVYYYIFNTTRKPFDDVRVRKAFSMAINRQELTEKVLKAGDVPTAGLVPPMGGFVTAKGNGYNPEEAKKLLAAAGFPGGKDFPKFVLIYNTSARHKMIAEWVQQQWKTTLGIDVELQNLEWNTFLDTRSKTHDFSVTRAGWQADYLDPGNYLEMFLTAKTPDNWGNNDGMYSNKKYDSLMAQAAQMPAGAKRNAVMQQAEDILVTQDQAVAPFFFYVNQNLIDLTKWGGWYKTTMDVHPLKNIFKK